MRYFLIFLLSINLLFAKHNIKLIDDENNHPISFAKVTVFCLNNCKDSIYTGITNKVGILQIKYNFPFKVFIDHLGYQKIDILINDESELEIRLKRKEFILDEVVTTGQYTPRSTQKSVYQVKSISAEKIQAQSAFNLRDLMMNELNVRISQDNILGSSLTINGLSGQNVKILIDGVPIIGRLNGNIDLSQINLNNAERVEIIEGPMSTMFGSDAAGGIINIITRDFIDEKFNIGLNSYYESVGTYNFDGTIGYNFGKNNFLINGGRNFFNGYSPIDTSRHKQWKPKEQYFADWQTNYFFDKSTFRYFGRFFYDYILNKGEPIKPYRESAFDDHYRTYRLSNSLSWKGEITKFRYFDLLVDYSYYERRKNTYLKNLVTLNQVLTADSSDQDTSKFNAWLLRGTYSHDNAFTKLSYQVGIEINLQSAKGEKIENLSKDIQDYGVFTSLQYKLFDNLIIQPALRFIYNSEYDAPLVPSLNLKYDVTDYLTIRSAFAKGFRAPSIQELYFYFVDINHNIRGNKQLKAENSNTFLLDLTYHSETLLHAFKLEPFFFYNDVNDLISLANVSQELYSYINIGNFKSMGFGINLSYIRTDISSKFGISWTGKKYKLTDTINAPDFIFNPEFNANIIWTTPIYDTKLSIFYKFNGEQSGFYQINETDYQEYKIDSYHICDINLSKDFIDNKLNIFIGVKNLFNVISINQYGIIGGAHSGTSTNSPVSYGRIITCGLRFNL